MQVTPPFSPAHRIGRLPRLDSSGNVTPEAVDYEPLTFPFPDGQTHGRRSPSGYGYEAHEEKYVAWVASTEPERFPYVLSVLAECGAPVAGLPENAGATSGTHGVGHNVVSAGTRPVRRT